MPEHIEAYDNQNQAIVDTDNGITLMESGAIMLYLAEKTGKLIPSEPAKRWQAIEWRLHELETLVGHSHQTNALQYQDQLMQG